MADHRHKRDTNARRLAPFRARAVVIAGPLAFLATASVVSLGVLGAAPKTPDFLSAESASSAEDDAGSSLPPAAPRDDVLSRSGLRANAVDQKPTKLERVLSPAATKQAIKQAEKRLWTQATLNLWTQPGEKARKLGEVESGTKVLVTGRTLLGRDEVVVAGKPRWVTRGYLSPEKPFTLGGECTNGTSVPDGVSENVKKVHAAVCAEFPEITVYGTFRGDGEHAQGIAVDIMVSGDRGWEVAEFVRKYYVELGVSYLIYSQNIWSVERGGEGWRSMEDRGSTTANHYDHVHVTTY